MTEPTGPIRSDQVAASTAKTPEEIERERRQNAVQRRIARNTALKKLGVRESTDAAERLEGRLKRIQEDQARRFRAQKAVRDRLNKKESS